MQQYAEAGCYADTLEAVLIPRPGGIDRWPTDTLKEPSLYESTTQTYGVQGLRWEDGKTWWIEGDGSYGKHWSVGRNVFGTGPSNGADIVPVPHLGRAVLVGTAGTTPGTWIADAGTGNILHALTDHGDSQIHGCYRVGNHVIVFDQGKTVARQINASDGTYTDFDLPVPAEGYAYGTGFFYAGKRYALPRYGSQWTHENCGIAAW